MFHLMCVKERLDPFPIHFSFGMIALNKKGKYGQGFVSSSHKLLTALVPSLSYRWITTTGLCIVKFYLATRPKPRGSSNRDIFFHS